MEPATHHPEDGGSQKSLETPLEKMGSLAHGSTASLDNHNATIGHNLALVDEAIAKIGFGKFQWQLTLSCGFGFIVDQMLLVSISLVMPAAAKEFNPQYPKLLSASQYAGLFMGSVILGTMADNLGRKLVWQLSIFAVSAATMIAAAAPNWTAMNFFIVIAGFCAGGNLSIDLAMLSESIPKGWSLILPALASTWGLGNLVTGLIAWPLLLNFSCPGETCSRSENMGWRYLYITLGGLCLIMAIVRTLVLGSRESPRWLVSCGRISDAVNVLNFISKVNKSTHIVSEDGFIPLPDNNSPVVSIRENTRRFVDLFAGARKARTMICMIFMWLLIGIAYPLYTVFLPYYLAAHGAKLGSTQYSAYRDFVVSSTVGTFGPFLAAYMVSTKWLRSRWTMLILSIAAAAFEAAFTTVRSEAQNLAFSCMINFWLNGLYAVIYSYTPLALSVENRGLGTGFLMAIGRLSSLSAPFIATFADTSTSAPLWVACAAFILIGLAAIASPLDTEAFKEYDV